MLPPEPSVMPAVLTRAAVLSYCTRTACVRYAYVCIYGGSFTPISGSFNGGWQLDAVVHPLGVTHPPALAALGSLLHQEAEDVAWILWACAVPLQKKKYTLHVNVNIKLRWSDQAHMSVWWLTNLSVTFKLVISAHDQKIWFHHQHNCRLPQILYFFRIMDTLIVFSDQIRVLVRGYCVYLQTHQFACQPQPRPSSLRRYRNTQVINFLWQNMEPDIQPVKKILLMVVALDSVYVGITKLASRLMIAVDLESVLKEGSRKKDIFLTEQIQPQVQ